jgi:hypothetical protein
MKNRFVLARVLLSAFALTGVAYGQSGVSGSGNMGVSATITGSILLTFATDTGNGMAVTGTGTSTASLPFSTVQMFGGSVPTGVTKTLSGVTSFTLSTPFNVRVDLANDTSSTCTLSALLSSTEAGTKVWSLGGLDLTANSGVTPTVLTALGAYATAVPYTLTVTVLATDVTTAITNSIAFTAVSN